MNPEPKIANEQLRQAISMLVSKLGSKKAAAQKMNMSDVYLNDILKGKTTVVGAEKWQGMEPALRPYLSSSPSLPAAERTEPVAAPSMTSNARPADKLEAGLLEGFRRLDIDAQIRVVQCVRGGVQICADPTQVAPAAACTRSPSHSHQDDIPNRKTA